MSHRLEALELLYREVEQTGKITIRNSAYKAAKKRVEDANKELYESRKNLFPMDHPSFYRIGLYGSSRFDEGDEEYEFVKDLSFSLVKEVVIDDVGLDIMTGGGPGIMEAAHKGTHKAIKEAEENGYRIKSKNHGVNIELPNVEDSNGLAHISTKHADFPPRLQEFFDKSMAGYIAPGGIGTLLELAMVLQLRQVGHIEKYYPILAHPVWLPVIEAWNDEMYHKRHAEGRRTLIDESDLNLVQISNCIPDIVQPIKAGHAKWFRDFRSHLVKLEN